MAIVAGREEGIRLLATADIAFIGTLTDYYKGMSTRSFIPTIHYTLEFEKYDQIRGKPIVNEEPLFHFIQSGNGSQIIDPKTYKLIPTAEPKRLQMGQLYLALLDYPEEIKQLVEINTDDIESIRQAALEKTR